MLTSLDALLRGPPDMMSVLEGGSWKSGRSTGGCVNFILQISSKCGQGGEGVQKSETFADVITGCSLNSWTPRMPHSREEKRACLPCDVMPSMTMSVTANMDNGGNFW